MLTEGKVRAIAASVAGAIMRKIKPTVSEEQIRSDVEEVIRRMQESGELTGASITEEQMAELQKKAEEASAAAGNALSAAGSAESSASIAADNAVNARNAATSATEAKTAAETAKDQAQAAQTAAEAAKSTASQKATEADNAAQTATGKATEAAQSATAAGTAKTAAEDAAARAEEAANRLLGVAVVGNMDSDNNIILTGNLAAGTYTFAYVVRKADGTTETVDIGSYTVEEETEEPDPEPATYTVTFMADGVTVATVTYEAGATSIEEPDVPAKEGYTGVWEAYTLDGNITVNAVYTKIEVESTNILTSGAYDINLNKRWSSSSTAADKLADCDGMITLGVPMKDVWGKTIYFKGFTANLAPQGKTPMWMASNGNTLLCRLKEPKKEGDIWAATSIAKNGDVYSIKIDTNAFDLTDTAVQDNNYTLQINIGVAGTAITSLPSTLIMTIDEPIE